MCMTLQTQAFLALVALLVPPAVEAFAPSISLRPSLSRGARFSATSCNVEDWGGITMSAAHRCLDDIRTTTERVTSLAKQVSIDEGALFRLASDIATAAKGSDRIQWDKETHYWDGQDLTAQYLLVLDALNFCFWPSDGAWEYGDLAKALRDALLKDKSVFSADKLASLDEAKLTEILGGRKLPQMAERVRILREVGSGLKARYSGHAANMIRQAGGSAEDLVGRITEAFPGFRDHAVYSGCQVFFYKRAQIFVGDVWGAYGGSGLGDFGDINRLTMFADYRVPQILQAKGVMVYGQDLKALVDSGSQLPSGGAAESEIRAVTVQAVERLKQTLVTKHKMELHSIEIDWMLWEEGEAAALKGSLPPHHKTLTVYY